MMDRGRLTNVLTTVAGLLLICWGATEVWATGPGACAGLGKSGTPKGIKCQGQCPTSPPTACPQGPDSDGDGYGIPAGRGTFPPGHPTFPGKTYAVCLCPSEIESGCCHLVGVLNAGGTAIEALTVSGDCTSCPASGVCQLGTNGGGEKVAECG